MPENTVMPTRQRHKVVMHLAYDTRIRLQMTVAFMGLYLVFVGSHCLSFALLPIPVGCGRDVSCDTLEFPTSNALNSIAEPTKNINTFFVSRYGLIHKGGIHPKPKGLGFLP
jgi:hypothetical protein